LGLEHQVLHERRSRVRYNWGFLFAIWCALLWAFSHQGIGMLVGQDSFLGIPIADRNPFFAGVVTSILITFGVALTCFIWMSVSGLLSEFWRVVRRFNRINLTYLVCAVVGGSVAAVSFTVANMLDTTFAVAMVMFYPAIGALIANLWYREKVSRRVITGMAVIVVGCVCLYLSDALPATAHNFEIISLLGAIVGLGWGVESALAARAMDFTDARVGITVRFVYEALIWVVVIVVTGVLFSQQLPILGSIAATFQDTRSVIFLLVSALCLGFNYFSWYQSFLFCGVSRALAVSDVSGFITVTLSMALMVKDPSFTAVLACLLMVFGVFLVYCGPSEQLGVLRKVNLQRLENPLRLRQQMPTLSLKMAVLQAVASMGGAWDTEIYKALRKGFLAQVPTWKLKKNLQQALIELEAAGLIVAVEDAIDDGHLYKEGALLARYQLTMFGHQRMLQMSWLEI